MDRIDDIKHDWDRYNHTEKFHKVVNVCLIVSAISIGLYLGTIMTGCTQADRASYNISQQADNFNIVRRVTVIDCITGDVLFQMSGKMSIYADNTDHQLEITVESDGTYQKHIIGLSDNVTYVVEDLNLGANEVSQYQYKINFNPKMWLPVGGDVID